jgi:hypothetical protein
MQGRRLIFALFAAAILFSMIREWKAPATCTRVALIPPVAIQPAR